MPSPAQLSFITVDCGTDGAPQSVSLKSTWRIGLQPSAGRLSLEIIRELAITQFRAMPSLTALTPGLPDEPLQPSEVEAIVSRWDRLDADTSHEERRHSSPGGEVVAAARGAALAKEFRYDSSGEYLTFEQGLVVVRAGSATAEPLAVIDPAWVKDANGKSVDTWYSIVDNTVTPERSG